MKQRSGYRSSIFFICSPNLGILDNWLPVVFELQKNKPDVEFICVFPKAGTVNNVDLDNLLIKMSKKIFDTIIFRSHSGVWLQVGSYQDAKRINKLNPLFEQFIRVSHWISRCYLLGFLSKLIFSIYRFIDQNRFSKRTINIKEISESAEMVLYDVYEETKGYNADIFSALGGVPKFSVRHGIATISDYTVYELPETMKRGEIRAYLFSSYEKDYYKSAFQLLDKDLKVVGIPRHDVQWIDRIIDEQKKLSDELSWKDYLFVISRSLSPYFPYERKRKALEDIKRLAFKELKKNVIVKLHPKERSNGLYEEVFGTEAYGSKWVYSNFHPFVLGKRCLFGISFFSGVPIDMLAINVPVIERLDLRGLFDYDNHESLRDDDGDPVFSLRYEKLVLGASNYSQMRSHAYDIINRRTHVVDELKARYNKKFPSHGYVSQTIASDILSFAKLVNENRDVSMKMRHTR